ncbi:Protein lingerer [Frankliniella fusca]|uniref:Protein lingerer n=1 Tax=Frankliniella fusca TaxID=407009 RepID=A0AAE1HXZ9_9NEOP|nr:Protein lingerer [Frankliniella fusca]
MARSRAAIPVRLSHNDIPNDTWVALQWTTLVYIQYPSSVHPTALTLDEYRTVPGLVHSKAKATLRVP